MPNGLQPLLMERHMSDVFEMEATQQLLIKLKLLFGKLIKVRPFYSTKQMQVGRDGVSVEFKTLYIITYH